ncbi:hypothetical protein D3C76_1797350 [compost metagenome]
MRLTKFLAKPDLFTKNALSDDSMKKFEGNVPAGIDVHRFRFSEADNELANEKLLNFFEKKFWGGVKKET